MSKGPAVETSKAFAGGNVRLEQRMRGCLRGRLYGV